MHVQIRKSIESIPNMASNFLEKASLSKLRFHINKPRPIRILVIGQRGVGKTGKYCIGILSGSE